MPIIKLPKPKTHVIRGLVIKLYEREDSEEPHECQAEDCEEELNAYNNCWFNLFGVIFETRLCSEHMQELHEKIAGAKLK